MAEGGGEENTGGGARAVFVSYASQDAAVANAVVAAFERNSISCWIAPRDVTPGAFYADEIVHAIDAAKALVLILSQHSADSQHVLREVERAASKRHPVVSLRIDRAPLPAGLEYFLNTSHWLDASGAEIAHSMTKLTAAIRVAIQGPIAAPAAPPMLRTSVASARARRRTRTALLAVSLSALVIVGFGAARLWVSSRRAEPAPMPNVIGTPLVPSASLAEKSVAVLPFVDLSEKKDEEYFSDGLTEELIDMLTKVPELRVPARTSSFYFKGKQATVADIAKALNVAQVLEGSVRKSGNQLRITVQLIRVADGFHVWSHSYDRKLDDIFKLQDDIAGAVVTALQASLANGSALRVSTTSNSEAFAHYLRARDIASGASSVREIAEAAEHLRTAVRLDPGFAVGWSSLANVLFGEITFGELHNDNELLAELRNANQKALALNPDVAIVQLVNAEIQSRIDWNWAAAALSMQKAYNADSTNADNCAGLAAKLFMFGRDDATAIELLKKAVSLDPLNDYNYASLGAQYFVLGRQSEAEAALREAVRLSPLNLDANKLLGDILVAAGKPSEALAIYQNKLPAGMRLRGSAMAYFELGRYDEAKAALDDLEKNYAARFAYSIAEIHSRRHEIDAAFGWLERAYALHDSALPDVNRDPWFKNLHRDGRWRAFLQKLNLPEIPS